MESLFEQFHIPNGISTVFEDHARSAGYSFVAGVDEVGRGCLAGAVVAAACILDPRKPLPDGLNDSKRLTANQRISIAGTLKESCLGYAIGQVEAEEIDSINILRATMKAMRLAIQGLQPSPNFLLVDAVQLKEVALPQRAIIKGDATSASIAAASVLAKTYRDSMMAELDAEFPQYGFAEHAGYGTKAHFEALRKHGPCRLHRLTFRGVAPATCADAAGSLLQ